MSSRVLVIHAHPFPRQSKVNLALRNVLRDLPGVEVRELYELYPDFNIDAEAEKAALLRHEVIVAQHPIYWYQAPALLKHWIDVVYERGFAYGEGGDKLKGKRWMQAISLGGPESDYVRGGYHSFTMLEFLRPFEQTANLCQMTPCLPFLVAGGLDATALEERTQAYRRLIEGFVSGRSPESYSTVNA